MPALMLLVVISSRLRLLEEPPDVARRASVSTSPYAVGLSTGVSTIVARAWRSRCSRMTAARSICVSTSPLNTTTDSVSLSPAYLMAPAVPSGAGSTT